MSSIQSKKEQKARLKEKQAKKEVRKILYRQFRPLVFAIASWAIVMLILHLPAIQLPVIAFFVKFTLKSAIVFGKIFFIPIESPEFPFLKVAGYQMVVIMECTAYNFYVFSIFLSLFSPGTWKRRLVTLGIFLISIFVINNLRFITMGYVGKYYPAILDQLHDYIWNILFGFFVFLIWLWRNKRFMPALPDKSEDEAGSKK
jgi:exosortase/archaeosortase family protein